MWKVHNYYEQGNRLFEDSLRLTESITAGSVLDEKQALSLLDTVSSKLNSLSTLNERYLKEVQQSDDETVSKIVSLQKECVSFSERIRSIEAENKKVNTQLEGLRSKKESLDNDVSRLNRDISNVRDRIREESRKKNEDQLGNIPIFGAIITGKPQHLIPGVAAVEGIISALNKEEEYYQRRLSSKESELSTLNNKIRSISRDVFNKTKEIDVLKEKLLFSREQLKLMEAKRNLSGKRLNIIRENKTNLGLTFSKFKLIKEDVSDVRFCITNELLEKEQISGFIRKICEIREVFLSIKNDEEQISTDLQRVDIDLESLNQQHTLKIQEIRDREFGILSLKQCIICWF